VIAWAVPEGWSGLLTGVLTVAFVGALSAPIFLISVWRGAASAIGGPLGGCLVGSPIIIGLVLLASALASASAEREKEEEVAEVSGLPIASASVAWCLLVVLGSTASETTARLVVVNRPVIRGLFALGLGTATASLLFCLVQGSGLVLNAAWFWLMRWVVFVALAQLAPALIRWRWRTGFSILGSLSGLATVGVVLLAEWASPGSSMLLAGWVVLVASVVLLNARTADLTARGGEVGRRLRTRLRTRRLPVRIHVTRA
jgi:hypothetical protein